VEEKKAVLFYWIRVHCISTGFQHFINVLCMFPKASNKQINKNSQLKHYDCFYSLAIQNDNGILIIEIKCLLSLFFTNYG
jgi:hypothetical protein